MSDILVSVSVITYNQEQYIVQALESIIAQRTTFPFEIVIGDDCSTDTTRAICLEYKEKYPNSIRLRLPQGNMGSMPNWIANMDECKGKYIAFCEGDDYWTDPLKLQKQVGFLESHPDFTLCAHVSDILEYGHEIKGKVPDRDVLETADVINQDWGIMTASMMIRRGSLFLPDWYGNVKNGDYGLQLLISLRGKTKLLSDSMSVYRRHEAGISNTLKPFSQAAWVIYLLYEFDKYTAGKYKKNVLKKIKRVYKNQIGFAKEYGLRKATAMLYTFKVLSCVSPFLIKNMRN